MEEIGKGGGLEMELGEAGHRVRVCGWSTATGSCGLKAECVVDGDGRRGAGSVSAAVGDGLRLCARSCGVAAQGGRKEDRIRRGLVGIRIR